MAGSDALWHSIEAHAGQVFRTKTGIAFTYTVRNRYVVLDNTNRSISRTDFAKAHERMPLNGPGPISNLVQGSAYVFGILTDPRIGG